MSAAMTAETPSCPASGSRVRALSAISVSPLPSRRPGTRRRGGLGGLGLRVGDRLFLGGHLRVLEVAGQREVHDARLLRAGAEVDGREPAAALQGADVV